MKFSRSTTRSSRKITAIFLPFFLSVLFFGVPVLPLFAAPVSVEMAMQAARKMMASDAVFQRAASFNGLRFRINGVEKIDLGKDTIGAYCVRLSPVGYIVLSADDRLNPVIAYSTSTDLDLTDDPSNALRALLKADLANAARILRRLGIKGKDGITQRISRRIQAHVYQWNALLTQGEVAADGSAVSGPGPNTSVTGSVSSSDPVIGPLLGTLRWNQNNHYNELCPVDPAASSYYDGHMPTGCVATATGQIMKYYHWPPYGFGSHSYDWHGQELSAIFDDPFQWELMKDSYDPWSSEPLEAEMAVSELLYELGVSVEMDYDTSGSSASTDAAVNALETYFYFDAASPNSDQDEFPALLQQEIEEGRPVLAGLANHAVVIDGRNSSVSPPTFHVNYGWGGANDGWYTLDSFPSGGGVREIITGMVPMRLALMDKPAPGVDEDGEINLSWHYPRYWNGEVTGFQLLEAQFESSVFLESGDSFSSWMPVSQWQITGEAYSGAGFYFPPDQRGNAPLMLMEPFVPGQGAQIDFYAKAVVIDARLVLEVSTDSGRTWQAIFAMDSDNSSRQWEDKSISLEHYAGDTLLLRFRVDATASPFNYYTAPYGGVWLDEIEISGCSFPDWQVLLTDIPASVFEASVSDRNDGTYLYRILSCSEDGCSMPSPAITVRVEIEQLTGDFDSDGDVDGKDAAVLAGGFVEDISIEEFASAYGTVR